MPIFRGSFGVGAVAAVTSADAYTEHQNWMIEFVARIALAGTGDRCPRYRVIDTAIVDELRSDGLTADDLTTKEFDDRLYMTTMAAQIKYG